jgi:CRISPR/Cas system CSM-associated protein Csm3 (group 7 of RAMP superfamily)
MGNLEISWQWKTATPFHIGSGFSRAGFVDRAVRQENGFAVIPSSAVKGAIRGAAEQLCRWLGVRETESDTESIPRIPVVRRIFAPNEQRSFYRFCGCRSSQAVTAYPFSSTKIDRETRSAQDNSLRTIEMLPSGVMFEGRIQMLAGEWGNPDSTDYQDALFLAAALAATESIGGKKGTGLGLVECQQIKIGALPGRDLLTKPDTMTKLRKLIAEGSR